MAIDRNVYNGYTFCYNTGLSPPTLESVCICVCDCICVDICVCVFDSWGGGYYPTQLSVHPSVTMIFFFSSKVILRPEKR